MSATAKIVDPVTGHSTLVRPRFSPGQLLRDDDLRLGVEFTRDLSRLLVRSLFGCGVVCGLKVEAVSNCGKLVVTIGSGVALNCLGDPIQVPRPVEIVVDPTCGKEIPDEMWVSLCRKDKCCAPRSAVCSCEDETTTSVCTREQEGFELQLVTELKKDCTCSCEAKALPSDQEKEPSETSSCWCADPCDGCYRDHYAGECSCECCDGECVILAVVNKREATTNGKQEVTWTVNHSVRRFVRPVLMRDPVVHHEQYPGDKPCEKDAPAAQAVEDTNASAIKLATDQAGLAAANALQKAAEVRSAIAAGRLEEAQVAATAAREMAIEAEISAKTLAEKALEAAASARLEVKRATTDRKAAEAVVEGRLKAANVADPAREAAPAVPPPPEAAPVEFARPRPKAARPGTEASVKPKNQ